MLTDGFGTMKMSLVISRLDTLDNTFLQSGDVTFTDPLHVRRLYIRLSAVRFPVMGQYQVTLLANREWLAQCVLNLVAAED
jgi:hypothetical protein